MAKKYKISVFILVLLLCVISLIFVRKKEANAYSPIDVKKYNLQIAYINKHNVFSSENNVKYIGHRGMAGQAPENTLPAFELAGNLGFWGAECDVHTTSDGNWVILHDDTVDRMTNGIGHVKNLSLKSVQALNIDSGNNISNYKGIKIPKLQEYLLTCKKWGMVPVIDMKTSDNLQYYDKFLAIIKEYGNIEKTVVISSSMVSLNELRKRDISLTLGLLCTNIDNSNILYVKTLGNAFIDCSLNNIDSKSVNLCHQNNIKVGAWTTDDIVLANKLIQKKVDFITTNKLLPEKKKQVVSLN